MRLYFVDLQWFDSHEEKDRFDKMFVFGENMAKAVARVESCFTDIQTLNIDEVQYDCGSTILYVPDDNELIRKIVEANTF